MKRIPFISLFLLLFYCTHFFAQNELPKNDLDSKYTPNPSSIFNNLVKKSYDENSYTEIEFKQLVKFCPTMLARQKVCFFYEREIVKGFVGTAGIGKAFGRDVFQNGFFTLNLSSFSNPLLLSPQDALSNCSYLNSWPLLFVGGKIYFSGTSFDEVFFEFNYKNERMNYVLSPTIQSARIDGEDDITFKMNAYSIGFGFTVVGGNKSNVVHELFFNVGLKTFKFTEYDLLSIPNPVSISPKNDLVYRKTDSFAKTRIIPTLNIGYSFGFGW